MNRRCKHGYTLIEILIALFIFSIIAVIVSTALTSVLKSRGATQESVQRLAEIQMAMSVIERDLSQIIIREVHNEEGNLEQTLYETSENGSQRIALTRAGYANPLSAYRRSTLQRIEYKVSNGKLIRINWPVLDRVSDTQFQERELLSDVADVKWRFLDVGLKFHDLWPPVESLAFEVPAAIEIEVTLTDLGVIKRLIMISNREIL